MQNSRWTRPFTVVALSVRARDWPQPLVHQGVTASINCVTLTAWRPGDRKNQANYRAGDLSLTWGGVREGFYNWKQKRKKKKKLFLQKCGKIQEISCQVKKQVEEQCGMCATFCVKNEENETTWISCVNLPRETVVQPHAIEFFLMMKMFCISAD